MTDGEMKIVARCEKCGRRFLQIGKSADLIDHWGPAKGSRVIPDENGECGGRIEMLSQPEPVY